MGFWNRLFGSENAGNSGHSLARLEKEVAKLRIELDRLKQELNPKKPFKATGAPGKFPNRNKPAGKTAEQSVVYDIHGNPVSTAPSGSKGRYAGVESGERTTRNLRKCRMWGCNERNEKDGYCIKHYERRHQKQSPAEPSLNPQPSPTPNGSESDNSNNS